MILEGIVTTLNDDGAVNISPMGPLVEPDMNTLLLRPFQTSTTYRNLKRAGQGIFHVTDDVELLARAALGVEHPLPALIPSTSVEGSILADACRWYAFRVRSLDERGPRAEILADVVDRGHIRDFFGFNRAKHAVLEGAILATRLHLTPLAEIRAEFSRLQAPVDKTGGPAEHRAFEYLKDYVTRRGTAIDPTKETP